MVNFQYKSHYDLQDLLEVMRVLRGPGGCPWDREQTHESIRRNLLEEAYEAADAIDSADLSALQEELGDVLMQVVFHAQIETEKGGFTLDDVADGVCKKLIYRHPHVFGTVQAEDSDTVLTNWEVLKRAEKGQASTADALDAEVRLYDNLFTVANPDEGNFLDYLNPDSLKVLTGCKVEKCLAEAKPGESYQFLRQGYFCVDNKDSKPGALVFNRSVKLKDSFKPEK